MEFTLDSHEKRHASFFRTHLREKFSTLQFTVKRIPYDFQISEDNKVLLVGEIKRSVDFQRSLFDGRYQRQKTKTSKIPHIWIFETYKAPFFPGNTLNASLQLQFRDDWFFLVSHSRQETLLIFTFLVQNIRTICQRNSRTLFVIPFKHNVLRKKQIHVSTFFTFLRSLHIPTPVVKRIIKKYRTADSLFKTLEALEERKKFLAIHGVGPTILEKLLNFLYSTV